MTKTSGEFRITGWHVLWSLVAFFLLVGVVNFFFIRVALETHSGTVGPNAYKAGLKYNDNIAAADRQANLGWQDDIKVGPDGKALVVTLTDADSKGIGGLKGTVLVSRPATDREDVKIELADDGGGRYAAKLPDGAYGNYVASLEIVDPKQTGETVVYRARRRLWVAH